MSSPAVTSVGAPATASAVSVPLNYPAVVTPGLTLYAVVADFGSSTPTAKEGWEIEGTVSFGEVGAFYRAHLWSKPATGTETGTESFTTSNNTRKGGWIFATSASAVHLLTTGSSAPGVDSRAHDLVTPSVIETLLIYFVAATKATAIVESDITPGGTDLGTAVTSMTEIARNQTNSIYLGACYEAHATTAQSTQRTSTASVTPGSMGQFTLVLENAESEPTIFSINGDDDVEDGQADVVVTHGGFSTITSVTLKATDGDALNFSQVLSFTNDGSDTLVDFPDVAALVSATAGVPFSSSVFSLSIELEDDEENIVEAGLTLVAKTGYAKVDIVDPVTSLGSWFNGFSGSVADAAQINYPTASNTTVDPDGVYYTDLAAESVLAGHVFDQEAGQWVPHSILVTEFDFEPDGLSFPSRFGQPVDTVVESVARTITGIDTEVDITIVDGEYAIDTGSGFGAYTSAAGTVSAGDQVKVRHTTAAEEGDSTTTLVSIGTRTASFVSYTGAESGDASGVVSGLISNLISW